MGHAWRVDRSSEALARERQHRRRRVDALVANMTAHTVVAGPFRGLRFTDRSSWGAAAPFLVGSYEEELHGPLEDLISARPTTVIDVGCAEGYYAVGLALRLPEARVFAYDVDPLARQLCAAMAALNDVDTRVHVRGECTVSELQALSGPGVLLILDCEGAELDLLRLEQVPQLASTTILVELHDFIDSTITAIILSRFRETHAITLHDSRARNLDAYEVLTPLSREDRATAVDETRPLDPHPMQWAVLVPEAPSPREQQTDPGSGPHQP